MPGSRAGTRTAAEDPRTDTGARGQSGREEAAQTRSKPRALSLSPAQERQGREPSGWAQASWGAQGQSPDKTAGENKLSRGARLLCPSP